MAENRFLQSPIDKLIEESKSYELPKIELPARSEPRSAAQSMRTSGLMPPQNFQPIFEEASAEYGVPLNVLAALGQQESSYNPSAVGQKTKWGRAKGLMQYLDSTASGLGINPFDAKQSIHAAAKQMRERLDKGYTLEEAIMAHHGGDDRRQWGPKTRQYVQDVMGKAGKIGQGFMQNVPQAAAAEEAEEFDLSAIQAELDAQEPGRFKVLSPAEAERYQRRDNLIGGQGQLQAAQDALKPGAPSPLTIENQQRAAESTPLTAPSPLTPENQIRVENGLPPKDTRPYQGFLEATGDALSNVPERFQQSIAGLIQMAGEDLGLERERFIAQRAQQYGITPGDMKLLAWAGNQKLIDPKAPVPQALEYVKKNIATTLNEQQLKELAAAGIINPDEITAYAKQWREDTKKTMAEVRPEPGSAAFYGSAAISSLAEMAPMIAGAIITRSPTVAMGIMGGQVGGQSYAEAREKGFSEEQAKTYAVLTAAAEAAPEALVVGRLLKPGAGVVRKVLEGTVMEGAQEAVTAALQAGIDKQMIDPNMTLREALVQIRDSAIIGMLAGGGMGGVVAGAESLANRGKRTQQERIEPTIDGGTPGPTQSETTPPSAAPATPASEAPQQVPPAAVNDNAAPAAQQAAPQPPKGPLSRAAERVIQQSGEPVTVVAPDGEVAGTLESYVDQGNGRWTARVTAEDGNTYDFTHEDGVDIVRSQTAAQPEPEAIEEASAIEEPAAVEQPAMPEQGAADTAPVVNPQLTTEQPSSKRTPLLSERIQAEAEKGLDQMSEAELRGELKAVAKQAKELDITKESPREVRNEHARLTKRRKAIEQAIKALTRPKQEEPVSAAKEIVERPKVEPTNSLQGEPASWVIRNKETGEVIMETFDKKKVDALNTEKYEAVPIQQHLGELNQKIKAGDEATVKESLTAGQPASAPQVGQSVVLGKGRQHGTITDVGDGFVKVKMGTRTEKMDMSTFNRRMAAAGDQAQPAPRRGEVGGMLAAGEVVTTSSGRQTTPFPKIDVDGNRKAVNTIKRVDQWLMQNAIDEARARGDEFNARQFEANLGRPSQADKDSAEEYLFGEQPPVMRSTLKPLVRDEAESAERSAKRTAGSQPNQTPVKDESPAAPEPKAEQPAASQTKPAGYGASNKLVTADRAAELRAKLKAKLNGSQLNSGIDPEILAMGTELAVFHLEAGVRKFAEFARTMAADLDMPMEKLRPYLRSFYNGARDMMEDANLSIEGMDGPDEVRAALRQLDAGDTAPAAPAAKRETVSTPAGREFEVQHKVIEADELVTSNDAAGAINPDYPKELQPRDRSRSASLDQINDIASKLNPRLLGESASATDGAPIVSPDNVVESGNGRTLAIRQAYARGMADRYREWLASQGYDVAGMKAPVLVRERVTPMTMDERIAYTTEANDRTTLELSSTERALSDARKMGPILHLYRGGDLQAAANRDFVRAFVGDVAAKADRGRILDGDGMLSQDGRRRIEAALLGSAYGDETLITDLFESADTDIKAIGGALLDVAGSWAKMREDAREGVISESVDTTPNLIEAVNLIRRARAEGRPILELVRQNDFFSGELDPVTTGFMGVFYRGESFTRARGRDKVADSLRYYTEQAQLSKPGDNLFGEPEVSGAEILRGTNDRLQRQEQQAGQQQDIFASPRTDGENAGAPGGNGQGPQPEAAGQAPAQGGLNAPGSRERVERDRPDAGAAQPVVQAADGDAAGQDAEGAGQAGRGADGEQGAGQRDQRLPGDGATAGRERGDQPAYRADGQFQPESITAGDPERTGSGGDSIQGQIVEQEREEAVADDAQAPGASDLDQRLAAQRKAQSAPTKWGDKASIDAALPLLLPEQRDDVLKAEQRLAGHNGILYTNGTGTGKAQPLDAKILTPRGWVRMGDIQVGDEVISVDGTPTKVLGVYPQGEKGIYRVTFDDGSSTECCDEHLWLTQTLYERRKASKNPGWNCAKPKVRELSEIRATLDKQHFIPVVAPVQLQGDISQNLLPAYTLGVILGDGDLAGGSLRFTNPDEEVASRVAAELPASMGMVKQESDERCVSYRLTNSENGTEADGTFSKGAVRIELERLGLHGTDSFGKFIPREYLSAKIADRIALLQGLMDTDGTADERTNSAYFTTVSPSLKDDFVELVQSLGGVARVSEKVPTYTYRGERRTGQKAYTVNVVLPEGIDPFSLPRKADKLKPRTWGQVRRKIVSVDFVGEKAAQCIAVEHESHLYVTDNYIVTHNTATGLGVAKRFINDGKDNIVIVVPSDKIASDWVKFARMLGVELKQLADTNDNGKTGPIVTTYANFGQNESLAQRDWDLVIADESHYLSSNEGGDSTAALEQLRALTGHHAGFYRWVRQRHAKEWQAFSAAMQDRADANGNPDVPMERYIALEAAEAKAREKWNAIEQPAREKWNQRWAKQDGLPKTVMLSATPFAYAKNVDYAEGYLFHYVEPADLLKSQGNVGGYNSGSPRDRFLMQHFGYRMRYNKLTAPESGVNSQLMEQQFNQWLKSTGALSGRRLEVAHDYDRKFVLVDDAVGTKIDEGLKYLREAEEGRYREVYEAVSKQFDYQRRMYLLESMKARAAVPIIREHLALGRKVVVFHDFNKGGGFNPFNDAIREIIDPDVKSMARSVLSKPMFKLDFSGLFSPIETLGEAFPDALFFNGTVSKGQRRANADLFNDDDSGRNLIVVQSDAGREGVSLHDTTGRHQRVEINLGMPVKPVAATQIEGRIYRTGQASDAIFRYLTTGTAWEAAAFASKIAERASTAENLALGEEARGLKEAFIDAYQNADAFPASAEDGKGGKDYDRKLSAAFTMSPFDRAKTFYWAQQKNSKRRDQREGQDYFATPEPVGFKMVEWANIQPNDKALEPSAGHGAIARFFPEQSDVTMVEPSYELSQRAALANGNARIVNDRFEQLHINNKFDAIVMNPPYGSGGKTSTEHLAKAAKHLRDGGRIVALIPRGGMADKRLADFLESEEAADLYTVAKIAMPAVTFERAGTAVNTQVLVLEKHANAADAEGILQRNIDLSNAESVNELFDRLESLSLPDRQPTSTPEPKQEIIEHTTAKGKVLRGIIRTDLTKAEAQEIDRFTFRKKNAAGETGWFIRAKHLDQGPRYSVAAEADRNLIAIHNLSAENLAFADKMGGIAVPSIGVVTTEAGGVDGFGEITLIGTKDLGNPRQEPVFSADAYTVRFPRPEFRKAKIKDADAILKPLKPISEEFDDRRVMDSFDAMVNRGDGSSAIDDWMSSPAAMAMFLREKGHDVKPAMRDATLDSPFTPADILEMEGLINKANRLAELDQNDAPEVVEAERLLDEAIDKKYAKRPALAGKVKERLMGQPGWAAFTLKGDLQKAKRGPDVDPWETRTKVRSLLEEHNLELEFKQWVESKILPVMGEPLLTVGRKKVPYTLDNIVDVMTRGPVRGQEKTMAFGAGNARAASSIEFSDVEQMRKAAAESIVDPQQYEEAKKVTEKLLDQYRDAAIKFTQHTTWDGRPDTFEALDASMRAIAKFSTKKKRDRAAMEAALKSEKFDVAAMKAAAGGAATTVDKSLIQSIEAEIQKWAGRLQKLEPGDSRIPEVERRLKQNQDALQEELAKAADQAPRDPIGLAMLAAEALLNAPVPYFEAKPQRAVSLNEFAGAVVPKNLPAEARAILEKNGIEIVEYEGDRMKAVREAANKLHEQRGDIRYSIQDGEAPLSVNQVRAAITRGPFGRIVDKMVEKGLIVIHSNSSTLPKDMGRGKRGVQAVTEPGGKVHLVASNLTQQNAKAVLLHEMFHSGVESLVGSKRWADLQRRLGSLYRQAEQSRGKARGIYDRARARVADAKAQGAVARRMEVEEFGAYTIEEYESLPAGFRKWVDDLVGAIKAWMFSRYGRQIGQVTPAQLRALAKDALITMALHRRGELFGPIAERFSATRITETPAFKRWFGDSKVVDAQGRPLVVYHGTRGDFDTFDAGRQGQSDFGASGRGFYFSQDPGTANVYATLSPADGAPNIVPVYLKLENPLELGAMLPQNEEQSRALTEAAKEAGHDGIVVRGADGVLDEVVVFRPEQIKSAIGNRGTFDPANPDIRYSVKPSEAFSDLNQSQKDFLDKIGPTRLPQRLRDRFDQLTDNLGLRIRQAGVDRYAALLRNDQALLGEDTLEGSIASSAWVLARMSHAAGGAVSAMMDAGRIYLDPKEKVIDVREGTQGLAATLRSLGSPVEIDRFMGWIAANRANKLFKQGRENLFSHSEIEAGMKLSGGKLENGKPRSILYAKAWKELQQHRDDVLGIAEQAGLLKPAMSKPDAGLVIARKYEAPAAIIKQLTEAKNALDAARTPDMLNTAQQKVDMANDALLDWLNGAVQSMKIDMLNTPQDRLDAITQELDDLQRSQRELWSEEFYVPFYRVIDEDSIGGPRAGSGLSRQQAYKKLKGGKQHLNDLLDNTLLNFHHLIQASLKNQAAAQAMANAEALGIAEKTTEAKRDKKASTYVMIDGEKQWYDVSDPLTFKAVSALSSAGLNTPVMKVGRAFKRFFTNMTTITPQFVVANGLRDTMSAMATSPTSAVPFKTALKGALTYWNDHNRARMMASGGAFSFGHVYGQNADEIKASLTVSMRKAKVLRDPKLIPGALLTAWRKYHAVTDFAENINRAGIWERNLEKGKLKAAFEARDLMDFSAHGDAIAIRILIDLVPFLNARIQGLDKMYRAGFKPGSKVAMGKGTKADRQAFARFLAVTGALTLASTLLFLNNYDDDEYRKLEDWQRDTYWIIRIGDEMFFIPKPFEVGAIATMGERLAEQFVDPAVGGEKFAQRLGHMLADTFSFDPTPQLVKPAVEVFWKNKDSFTGRPIEDQSMERLSPSLRSRPDTSRLADAASRGMEAAAGLVGGQDLALSPVQIDHLIRGYTGSVGATAVATADTLWRRAMGEELPARRWHEYQPIKRFYRDLTQEPTYTRYGTDFYEALKKADRAYADLMHLEKYGDEKRAAALAEEKADDLGMRKALNAVRRDLAKINADMKRIQLDKEMSGEAKRLELDRLRSLRNLITEQVGKDLEQEKIRRRAAAD